MPKTVYMKAPNPTGIWLIWCPACRGQHLIPTGRVKADDACWAGPGDPELPTFSPSINLTWGHMVPNCEPEPRAYYLAHGIGGRCHYFVRGGNIEYCGDCTHGHAGKVLALPQIREDGSPQGVSV